MDNMKTIAIVMPVYNAIKWIERAVDSVIKQTYKDWKLYIIDDCSSDDSINFVKSKYDDKRIVYLNNSENQGAARTRNRGIELAQEDVVCFLDSDDEWSDNKLALQVDALNKGYEVIFSEYYYINKEKNIIKHGKEEINLEDFLKKKFRVCFSSVCIDVSSVGKIFFKAIGHEDYEYIYRCINRSKLKKAFIVQSPSVFYYCQENSLSSNKAKAANWHYSILKNELKFDLVKRSIYFYFYFLNAVMFSIKNK